MLAPQEVVLMSSRSLPKKLILKIAQTVFPDRHFVSVLKFELSLLMVSIYSMLSPIEWTKSILRKNAKGLKVNIGNGPFKHDGWVNLDCRVSFKRDDIVCDLRRKWPLGGGSTKYIFAEHVFEHFSYPDEITHVLKECVRILEPGGVLRVIVPHTERYLRAYAENDAEFVRQVGGDSISNLALVNTMMRENGFHKYAYDYRELENVLKLAGFKEVRASSLRGSEHEELNLDLNEPLREIVSLYVEAEK
jgi:predicted SAM-dependent methyltransferase